MAGGAAQRGGRRRCGRVRRRRDADGGPALEARDLIIRPVRPADRGRVEEISADVWGGADYLPAVFDSWVGDPSAPFMAAELDGLVVGVHRLHPVAPGIVFYEGLRVDSGFRRQGIARSLVRSAMGQARAGGYAEMRLYTGSDEAAALFESEGFRLQTRVGLWTASRMEGTDLPRLASPAEAARAGERLRSGAGVAAYGGVNPSWRGALDFGPELLERLAAAGLVRIAPGGTAVALLRDRARRRLPVTMIAGVAGAVAELLTGLRVEADAHDLDGVAVLAPEDHPEAEAFAETGYHLAGNEGHGLVYVRAM